MSNVPEELRYAKTHEWVRREEDGTLVMGISEHAQELLGDLVYVELPEVGSSFGKMEPFGVIEAVKAVSDLYTPVGGEITAVNEALADEPAVVNRDPYGEGWMVKLRLSDPSELEALLSPADYQALIADS